MRQCKHEKCILQAEIPLGFCTAISHAIHVSYHFIDVFFPILTLLYVINNDACLTVAHHLLALCHLFDVVARHHEELSQL